MSEPLPALEKDRSEVLRQISHLRDLRPGSIVEVMGRCRKSNCHCAQPGDPGHGPHFRLTRKVQGKTVAETLSSPAALRKAQREVAEFRRFQQLSAQRLAVNEAICQRRPVEIGARTVPRANLPPMSNWISRTRNSLREGVVCRPWWARRSPSITGANR